MTPWNFKRNETFEMNSSVLGIKAVYDFSKKISGYFSGKTEQTSINGNVDYEMNANGEDFLRGPPWPYTQWRKAEYNGKGNITSSELGADLNLTKKVTIGLSAGSRSGKVKTS